MKDIKNYEGLYAITEDGKVWSYRSKKFLKLRRDGKGYLQVCLYKDKKKKEYRIHRLVAEAYLPNPDNKTDVHHIDEDPTNNVVSNLTWATRRENLNYGNHNKRVATTLNKPVYCVELDRVFEGAKVAAEELEVCYTGINKCCNGKQQTCGGYHWQYVS